MADENRTAVNRSELQGLPSPEAQAAAHSAALQQHIADLMERQGGVISFARFMELALYAPGLGYYVAGQRKFGAQGDFVTAPELSALFSRCVARQCRQVLEGLAQGEVLEFGAGSGVMAADILQELESLGSLPQRYCILELSPELQQRQWQTLSQKVPHLLQRVEWLQQLPGHGFRGVMLANEVLDAMPVQRFRIEHGEVRELYVGHGRDDEGRFVWETRPAEQPLLSYVNGIQQQLQRPFEEGYESELAPAQGPWVRALAEVLEQGAILLVDYGMPASEYYHPQRDRGTLMCHYRHRVHDNPLILVGLQDITAYVDFTAIAEAGVESGLALAGYTTQAFFLLGCGLEEMLAAEDAQQQGSYLQLTQQVKTLTMPGEMGERFKVMAFARGLDFPLCGFAMHDQRHRL